MLHYIKFELKNTLGYSVGMIVGGLLPLIIVIGNFHKTKSLLENQEMAKTLFATCLPLIPLGLVILPFTIAFAKDIERGVSTRLILFGYSQTKQMVSKFISITSLCLAVTFIYSVVLFNYLPLPPASLSTIINIIAGTLFLTTSFYFLSFTIAWFSKGFAIVQGIALFVYFGIGILTGTIVNFQLSGLAKQISKFIPFEVFRNSLIENWSKPSYEFTEQAFYFLAFLGITSLIFVIVNHLPKKFK
ncbi:MAG: ABC transporter permease [Streptococcaceae bacterium]|jgi:ABC-2 type transport system permease protein|nr:ABC transporter permease [Streptococcaceae bacterium]